MLATQVLAPDFQGLMAGDLLAIWTALKKNADNFFLVYPQMGKSVTSVSLFFNRSISDRFFS
jgi:hypothetical protein